MMGPGRVQPSRHLGMPQRHPGMHPGMGGGRLAGPSIFDQFNAWTDPNIGGEQPGPLQQGYGGFEALSGRGNPNTMMATKMNDFLNQYQTGGARETAMNQIGYFNGGNPFDPASMRGSGMNRAYRAQAQQGGYTAPGQYQDMANAGTGEGLNQYGGYLGVTNVDQGLNAAYSPLSPRPGRTRQTRTFGRVAY